MNLVPATPEGRWALTAAAGGAAAVLLHFLPAMTPMLGMMGIFGGGAAGPTGATGSAGSNGAAGATGATGATGANATPGGSTTQVQYNNASAFGGITGVTSDGTNMIPLKVTANPSAPASTFVTDYNKSLAATSSPGLPTFLDADLGFAIGKNWPFGGGTQATWGCTVAQAWSGNNGSILQFGSQVSTSATAPGPAAAWASTNALTRIPNTTYTTAATANLNAGIRSATLQMWRGSSSGIGGFSVWGAFSPTTSNSTQRIWVGVMNAITVPGLTADPSSCTDCVLIGADAGDTNLSIMSNDNVGSATKITTGFTNYPKQAGYYDFAIWAKPNDTQISYAVNRLDSAQTPISGTITTSGDLPRNTVQLSWIVYANSGANATVTTMEFMGLCWVANP